MPSSVPVAIEGMDIGTLDGAVGVAVDSKFKYTFSDVDASTVTTSSMFVVEEPETSAFVSNTSFALSAKTASSLSEYCDVKNALPAAVECSKIEASTVCVLKTKADLGCNRTYHICMTKDIRDSEGKVLFAGGIDKTFTTMLCDWSVIYGGTTCSTWDGTFPIPPGVELNYSQFMSQIPYTKWTDAEIDCLLSEIYRLYGADEGCLNSQYTINVSATCGLYGGVPQALVECTTDSECEANKNPSALCINNRCSVPDCGSYFTADCTSFTKETDCVVAFSYGRDCQAVQFRRCAWVGGACTTSYVALNNAYECVFNAANDRSNTADGGAYACDYNSESLYLCDTLFNGDCSSSPGKYYNVTDVKAQLPHTNDIAGANRAVMCLSHFATASDAAAECFSEETFRRADDICKLFDDSPEGPCRTTEDATHYYGRTVDGTNCREEPFYSDKWRCRGAYYYTPTWEKRNCVWGYGKPADRGIEEDIWYCDYTDRQCIQEHLP